MEAAQTVLGERVNGCWFLALRFAAWRSDHVEIEIGSVLKISILDWCDAVH